MKQIFNFSERPHLRNLLILFTFLSIFHIPSTHAQSAIIEELDKKMDVSRLEYSLDKLMYRLVTVLESETRLYEDRGMVRIEESCSYQIFESKNAIKIYCSMYWDKNFFGTHVDTNLKIEKYVSKTSNRAASGIMQIFGNFGDPLQEFPKRGNLMHEQLGKVFSKTCCENSSAKEILEVGKKLSEVIEIFVNVGWVPYQNYTYKYLVKDPFGWSNNTLIFPKRITWEKLVDGKLMIFNGSIVEN